LHVLVSPQFVRQRLLQADRQLVQRLPVADVVDPDGDRWD
jgi:hypothetical protein